MLLGVPQAIRWLAGGGWMWMIMLARWNIEWLCRSGGQAWLELVVRVGAWFGRMKNSPVTRLVNGEGWMLGGC